MCHGGVGSVAFVYKRRVFTVARRGALVDARKTMFGQHDSRIYRSASVANCGWRASGRAYSFPAIFKSIGSSIRVLIRDARRRPQNHIPKQDYTNVAFLTRTQVRAYRVRRARAALDV